ncbi:MAG: PEP-CTERM sorting domain-containing protein [Okeania sp. SIO3B3]|nr:PEP-CTERM sorting domain-containing protein [Okeania sp. SIO3B3]
MTPITTFRSFKSLLLTAVTVTFGATLFNVESANALTGRVFADEVVEYTTNDDLLLENSLLTDPEATLGRNDWTQEMVNGGSLGAWGQDIGTSLGNGGSLTVKFTNNALKGSGNKDLDLWIYEIGKAPEEMLVEISVDNETWYDVGFGIRPDNTHQTGLGFDIDNLLMETEGIDENTLFRYVRVTDTGNNTYTNDKSGADIDAIAALSSVDVPEPASIVGLLSLGIVGVSTLKRKQ